VRGGKCKTKLGKSGLFAAESVNGVFAGGLVGGGGAGDKGDQHDDKSDSEKGEGLELDELEGGKIREEGAGGNGIEGGANERRDTNAKN